jgi:anthranilate synthase component I
LADKYSLSPEAFSALAAEHANPAPGTPLAYAPISRRIPADMETPVSALLKVRRGPHSFLLESVERGSQVGRYSFLGTEPHTVFTARQGICTLSGVEGAEPEPEAQVPCPDPLAELQRLIGTRRLVTPEGVPLPRFTGGAVGYAGYETTCTLEPVRPAQNDPLGMPDLAFALYDTFLVFDHVQRTAQVVTLAPLTSDPEHEYREALRRIEKTMARLRDPLPVPRPPDVPLRSTEVRSNLTRSEFEGMVEAAREHIAAGDIIQVVLSQRFERDTAADPFSIYRALRMVNPSPYMFFLQFGDAFLVGASPEMLVQVQHGKVTTHPIAGTRPRGATRDEDAAIEKGFITDEKERAEHLMLVDLGRNDIGRIARIGSVRVPRFMEVEHYSHVMHLVSEVEGDLEPGFGPIDVLRACFPAGTVSGAPKVRAMQIISEQERDRRGPYAGALGYIGYDGNMDTAICIRTILVKDGTASVQAGAGIVADSAPENEYHETQHKARAMLAAIDLAEEIERDEATDTHLEPQEAHSVPV